MAALICDLRPQLYFTERGSKQARGYWLVKAKNMSRKKSSTLPALLYFASKLPWWLCLILAAASGGLLHGVASTPLPVYSDVHQVQSLMLGSFFKTVALAAQFVVPIIFLGGAIFSLMGRRKRRSLLDSVTQLDGNPLLGISWREFELLVGEVLRRQGFSVQESGGAGPDGGVDLKARKEGEKYLVQCKHWRSMQVGVPVVRELYGVMAAEAAVGGFVITSGQFTQPARAFAAGRNLQLVDGALLRRWIADAKGVDPVVVTEPLVVQVITDPLVEPEAKAAAPVAKTPPVPKPPACPHCRKVMVIKVARTGPNAGGNFWGCSAYPKCHGIRAIYPPIG
jgi:restriction system protein